MNIGWRGICLLPKKPYYCTVLSMVSTITKYLSKSVVSDILVCWISNRSAMRKRKQWLTWNDKAVDTSGDLGCYCVVMLPDLAAGQRHWKVGEFPVRYPHTHTFTPTAETFIPVNCITYFHNFTPSLQILY